MGQKKARQANSEQQLRVHNLILYQKKVGIKFPEFTTENAIEIECCVWDYRIEIAKNNPLSFRPSFKIAIKAMQEVKGLLASGGLKT
tara:strand:+ start:839 stop:1099 length:261 start_codon:yes stop_codon:yes gene_type:complete